MNARYISQHTKVKMYIAVVKSAVLYGCESRATTEQVKTVSKIYGPITDQITGEAEVMMNCRLRIQNQCNDSKSEKTGRGRSAGEKVTKTGQ